MVVLDASHALEQSNVSGGAVAVVAVVADVADAVAVVACVASDAGVVLGGACELAAAAAHVVAVDSIHLRRLEPSWEGRDDICYSKHSLPSSSSYNPPRWLQALER